MKLKHFSNALAFVFTFLPLLLGSLCALFGLSSVEPKPALAQPRDVYIDPETGYEVWRLTEDTRADHAFYYTNPAYSPNGRHIVFYSRRPPNRIHVMDADGSNLRGFGDWESVSGDEWDDQSEGAWSKDSRFYYAGGNLFVIEVDTGEVTQLSQAALPFHWPFLSPDGRTLSGLSIRLDSDTGGILKFIRTDGTDYREFSMPFSTGRYLDVSHGWLGNDHIWYQTTADINGEEWARHPLVDVVTGEYVGLLNVINPEDSWEGLLGHQTFSPIATALGPGFGLVAGHGRTFVFINTLITTQDRVERELRPIVDRNQYPEFYEPVGTHSNFHPSGKWFVLENVTSDKGKMAVYPVDRNSSPFWLVRFRPNSDDRWRPYHWPTWSPDGTKVVFSSDSMALDPGNEDLYLVVFRHPDPPTNLVAVHLLDEVTLSWSPAALHQEIKEYQIWSADSKDGTYSQIGTVSEHFTYLNAPSQVDASATTLNVDSTDGFPDQGMLEVVGLATSLPSELISYTSKTATTFDGCLRGELGTEATPHWNDSFVWRHTGQKAFVFTATASQWYKVRAVEWSGLESDFSEPATDAGCTDQDGDGFFAEMGCGSAVDCDDNDDSVYPGTSGCNPSEDEGQGDEDGGNGDTQGDGGLSDGNPMTGDTGQHPTTITGSCGCNTERGTWRFCFGLLLVWWIARSKRARKFINF
jgi:hypothetical protein